MTSFRVHLFLSEYTILLVTFLSGFSAAILSELTFPIPCFYSTQSRLLLMHLDIFNLQLEFLIDFYFLCLVLHKVVLAESLPSPNTNLFYYKKLLIKDLLMLQTKIFLTRGEEGFPELQEIIGIKSILHLLNSSSPNSKYLHTFPNVSQRQN